MRLKRAGVVPGHDLTTEAALAKLSYLLALPDLTIEDITRQMSQSLRGELTAPTQTAFVHPKSQLSTSLTELAALGYAVARGNLDEVRSCLRGNVEWMLNEGDYSGNTPLVSRLLPAPGVALGLTDWRSTLRPRHRRSRSWNCCCFEEHQCTSGTRRAGRLFSWRRTLDWRNTSLSSASRVHTCMLTSWPLRG